MHWRGITTKIASDRLLWKGLITYYFDKNIHKIFNFFYLILLGKSPAHWDQTEKHSKHTQYQCVEIKRTINSTQMLTLSEARIAKLQKYRNNLDKLPFEKYYHCTTHLLLKWVAVFWLVMQVHCMWLHTN